MHHEDDSTPIIKEEYFKLSDYWNVKKAPVYEIFIKYNGKSVQELVKITHNTNSSWERVFQVSIG